jgi:hypothetical protein
LIIDGAADIIKVHTAAMLFICSLINDAVSNSDYIG